MGLDIYLRRDIANVLRATACANEGAESTSAEYRRGVCNTLLSVGLAFGLEPVGAGTKARSGTVPALTGTVWVEVKSV